VERIIVRRGRFLTYELLRRTFGTDPNVEIIWDRRRPVDESSVDVDRRGRPPVEWERLDYIFTSGRRPISESEKPPS
jgi:hypothetical protein